MTIAIAKSAAEKALAEAFEAHQAEFAGAAPIQAARKAAIGTFTALGLPHRRIEAFKYTDVRSAVSSIGAVGSQSGSTSSADVTGAAIKGYIDRALGAFADLDASRIVLIDGRLTLDPAGSGLGEGVTLVSLSDALASDTGELANGRLSMPETSADALVALNTALMQDGVIVRIAPGARLSRPILVVLVRTAPEALWTSPRIVIDVGDAATATIIEAYVNIESAAAGQTNAATRIVIGDGAVITHVKVATELGTVHLGTWSAAIGSDTVYRPFLFNAGPRLTRNQVYVTFDGEGTRLDCSGVFLARGNEHVDNTLVIDHAVPGCESRELFKGVLDGNARGVFQGKVIVRQIAQKTDGKQMAQALMLSPTCEFDSKPELEIYADDVACGHGSTCAEIDPELVFYLRARGIPEPTARALLMDSFVAEAIEKVEDAPVREALQGLAFRWLHADTVV
ncbi:MAG: Fe-S cluster assembly protein SufD [Hyphomicrobiaceae bacterium]